MEWLSQNWLWIVLAVGALWMFSRNRHGGSMGGCCGGMAHEGPVKKADDQSAQDTASSHRP